MVLSLDWITAFEFWSCKDAGDTRARSEMTHDTLIQLCRLLGEPAETKGRVLHLSCDFLSFSVNIKLLIIPDLHEGGEGEHHPHNPK